MSETRAPAPVDIAKVEKSPSPSGERPRWLTGEKLIPGEISPTVLAGVSVNQKAGDPYTEEPGTARGQAMDSPFKPKFDRPVATPAEPDPEMQQITGYVNEMRRVRGKGGDPNSVPQPDIPSVKAFYKVPTVPNRNGVAVEEDLPQGSPVESPVPQGADSSGSYGSGVLESDPKFRYGLPPGEGDIELGAEDVESEAEGRRGERLVNIKSLVGSLWKRARGYTGRTVADDNALAAIAESVLRPEENKKGKWAALARVAAAVKAYINRGGDTRSGSK